MDNEQIDNPRPKTHNSSNNVGPDGTIVIRREDLKPLNDPNCEHSFVLDGEVIGDTRAWVCSKCHRGTFLPKTVKRII
jgi:hypothetical protein